MTHPPFSEDEEAGGFPEPTLPSSSETFVVALEIRRPGSSPQRGLHSCGTAPGLTGFAVSGATHPIDSGPGQHSRAHREELLDQPRSAGRSLMVTGTVISEPSRTTTRSTVSPG